MLQDADFAAGLRLVLVKVLGHLLQLVAPGFVQDLELGELSTVQGTGCKIIIEINQSTDRTVG